MEKRMNWKVIWQRVRLIWVTLGILGTIIFATWSLIAYRATPEAHAALQSDARVTVTAETGAWRFLPASSSAPARVGLLFFPGSLVDPIAYAPLARAAAEAGFPAYIIELPRRGAFGGAESPEIIERTLARMNQPGVASSWVFGGHSRGAVVACELASQNLERFAGLILIGTSHPRDVNLATLSVPVTKIIGTHDGLATLAEVEENKAKLPPSTHWVRIEGGNHCQFGWYGFQPGDSRATISPAAQREQMLRAVSETLQKVAGTPVPIH